MKEWVRVKDKRTGHQYSVVNVNPAVHEVLEEKVAVSRNGVPLDAKTVPKELQGPVSTAPEPPVAVAPKPDAKKGDSK